MNIGGACGFDTDVAQPPFSSMISAGNAKIFLKGHGCGQCFQVQCSAEQCSGQPITVTKIQPKLDKMKKRAYFIKP